MATWHYKYTDQSGEEILGNLESDSMSEAKKMLENHDGFLSHGYIGLNDLSKTSDKGESETANPHYVAHEKVLLTKESRPKQHAGTGGSVGWYENLGEKSLSDRGILIAQLHELRTIKRCVVCTILIVIVIPIVFGVITSA